MKDPIRHLKYTQKKVLQACRREERQNNSNYSGNQVLNKQIKNSYTRAVK